MIPVQPDRGHVSRLHLDCAARVHAGLREDLVAIAERFRAADQQLLRALVFAEAHNREQAETARWEAMGDYQATGEAIADLFLLLLRMALEYRPEAVQAHLTEVVRALSAPGAQPPTRGLAPVRLGGPHA